MKTFSNNSTNQKNETFGKEVVMKRINIYRVLAVICMLVVLFIPFITKEANAQRYSHHSGTHYGMAYLAEKEIREKEQKAAENNEVNIAINTTVAEDEEKGYLNGPEKTDSAEE